MSLLLNHHESKGLKPTILLSGSTGIGLYIIYHFYKLDYNIICIDNNADYINTLLYYQNNSREEEEDSNSSREDIQSNQKSYTRGYKHLNISDRWLYDIFRKNQLHIVKCDVANEKEVKSAIDEVMLKYKRLDILINNAAVSNPYNTCIENLELSDWMNVININLTGPMLLSKHSIPYLKLTNGSIINISSTRAFMSEKNSECYASSKGGLLALTHSLAISLGPNIRVNCIAPGWIETRQWRPFADIPMHSEEDISQHPVGRIGEPRDIAEMVEALAKNKFITGQTIIIDGGMTTKMIYSE